MKKEKTILLEDALTSIDDYTQSANALFHFMKQRKFLEDALSKKALMPRFCLEDVRYLNLIVDGEIFQEIAILQKCFCDIPLHKISANIELSLTEECAKENVDIDKTELKVSNNHPGFYGRFALAFSKSWCERNNLQPIHYINGEAAFTRNFSRLFAKVASENALDDEVANDVIHRLAFMKPLRGKMKRPVTNGKKMMEIEVYKNFHDEQEWRYVPDLFQITKLNEKNDFHIMPIIANPHLLTLPATPGENYLSEQSKIIRREEFLSLWLKFSYEDIRYIIVPDNQARLDIIEFIMKLPSDSFAKRAVTREKYVLLSKILVLDEIGRDW